MIWILSYSATLLGLVRMAGIMDVDEEQPRTPSTKLDLLEKEIEDLCRSMANGEVSEHELQEHFLDFSSDQLKIVVNRMVKAMKVQVKQDEQFRPCIRLRDPMIARKLSTIEDQDEIRTYEVIEQAGTKGIAQRIIKGKTKVSATKVARTLASLESKQLIKAVKLQKNTQHVKSYVLFHLKLDDPAAGTHTVFGSGTSFDTQCFEAVSKLSIVFLKNRMKKFIAEKSKAPPDEMIAFKKSEATVEEVLQSVISAGIVKADMNEESIEAVLKMLELEGKVERREYNEADGPAFRYRFHTSKTDRPEASIPCVGCPVKALCSMDSPINPMECPHFDNWIKNFNF